MIVIVPPGGNFTSTPLFVSTQEATSTY